MRPIIRVENLSKQYRIGARRVPYLTLRESIINAARSPFNWFSRNGHSEDNTIWALKDVSFEVMPGEVVGVIGRNGAGKSTLLKILSRITEPTTGQVDLYGRVGSLLEVGTGFHSELSGRENIYLNGAVLGMRRSEIERKFDEVVAFAEIERFIDTPVKHYSSGMYMRLAFAVAAHLEPEILVVDEVLAVGDAEFQKRCLGKMREVSIQEGRTVLFVSHNMTAVNNFCQKCMLLRKGQLQEFGETSRVVGKYLAEGNAPDQFKKWAPDGAPGNDLAKLLLAAVSRAGRDYADPIYEGDAVEFEFEFELKDGRAARHDVTFHLVDEMENLVFVGSTVYSDLQLPKSGKGIYRANCRIPKDLLIEGTYRISRLLFLKDMGTIVYENRDTLTFEVRPCSANRLGWQGGKEGIVKPKLDWETNFIEKEATINAD